MMKDYEFWFVVGSQFLYGPQVLETVASRAQEMADKLNASGKLPCKLVYKVTAKTNQEIADVVREANYDKRCARHHHLGATRSAPRRCGSTALWTLQKPYLPFCHAVQP